jgi:hypothetical protein
MPEMRELTDILYPIELTVLREWAREPSLIDLEVSDVFDALARRYVLEDRGQTMKPLRLSPKAERLYEALIGVAEALAGRRTPPDEKLRIPFRTDVTPSELAAGFKRLSKSVGTWSEQGGRQGYLEYIDEFLPR